MKKYNKILLVLVVTTFFAAGCKKDKIAEDQLPPITQTGANTFGCLVNGKVFIPKGTSGTGAPNPKIAFDFFNGNEIFSVNAYHYDNQVANGFLSISVLSPNITEGLYTFPSSMNFSIGWNQILGNCFTQAFDTTIKKSGSITLTRYDVSSRIISGTFRAQFKTTTCDTIYLTDGRFDFKY